MAKRARGSHRPGQRAPIRRTTRPATSAARPGAASAAAAAATPRQVDADAASPANGLTATEEARAAELEARILEEERQAEDARTRGRGRAARSEDVVAPRGQTRQVAGGLAVRYAHEYDYVSRDLKRIAALIASLTAIMVVLWILVEQFGLFGL